MLGSRLLFLFVLAAGTVAFAPPAMAQCAHGDLDGSGTVDLSDYALFVDCDSRSSGTPAPPAAGRSISTPMAMSI